MKASTQLDSNSECRSKASANMLESPRATTLARHSALLVLQGVVSTVAGTVGFAFVARGLEVEEMGAAVGLTFVLGLGSQLAGLGLSSAVTKHVAESRGKGEDYSQFLIAGISAIAFLGLISGGVVMLSAGQLSMLLFKTPNYAEVLQLTAVSITLVAFNAVLTASLLGLNEIPEIVAISVLSSVLRAAVAVVTVTAGWGLKGYVTSWVAGDLSFTACGLLLLLVGRHIRASSARTLFNTFESLFNFSWPLYFSGIVSYLYSAISRALLLAYLTLEEAGIYNVANIAFTVVALVPSAISTLLFPFYSERVGSNQHDTVRNGARAASRYVSLVYSPVALGAAVVANPAISLLAGVSYSKGDTILVILALFSLLTSSSAAFGGILISYGMTGTFTLINLASIAVGFASSALLAPALGGIGIALSTGLVMTVSFLLTFVVLRRRFGLSLSVKPIGKSLASGIVMALVVALAQAIYFDRCLLPVYVGVGGLTYFFMLKALRALEPGDFHLAREVLGDRLSLLVNFAQKLLL